MTLQRQSETQQSIEALLPTFEDHDEEKRSFLSFRICGFSIQEAARYAGVAAYDVKYWEQADSSFQEIHRGELAKLQREATDAVLEQERVKNYRLALEVDQETLDDAVSGGVDSLSDRQFEYLKTIRNKYDSKVTSLLGLQPGDRMPIAMDEVTVRFRRIANAEQSKIGDKHDEEGIEESNREESIIETEYTESPD